MIGYLILNAIILLICMSVLWLGWMLAGDAIHQGRKWEALLIIVIFLCVAAGIACLPHVDWSYVTMELKEVPR